MDVKAQKAQDTVRDGAALLLAYLRKDVPTIQAINDQTDVPSLLAGVLAVAGLIINFHAEDPEGTVRDCIEALSRAPESFWESAAAQAQTIEGGRF